MAHVLECLPSKVRALSSSLSITYIYIYISAKAAYDFLEVNFWCEHFCRGICTNLNCKYMALYDLN
jgi:hypothetical protein